MTPDTRLSKIQSGSNTIKHMQTKGWALVFGSPSNGALGKLLKAAATYAHQNIYNIRKSDPMILYLLHARQTPKDTIM